jgi:hypothetical protein
MTETKVHHQTERGARIALAKKLISQESYEAVLAGTLSLAQAKELGGEGAPGARTSRSGSGTATERLARVSAEHSCEERPQEGTDTPPEPTSRISKEDATQECWCGCGEQTKPHRRWKPGHDQRAKGIIKRAAAAGKTHELSDRLRDYGRERRLV